MSEVNFRQAQPTDAERCFAIESAAYAGDEAATREKILTRIQTYPQGFLVLENDHEIIGFINCGATDTVVLSDESFKELVGHDPAGDYIVIMSVAVHPDYQRSGYAGKLLQRFISDMHGMSKKGIYLICQEELVPLYAKFGFLEIGPSDSDHGGLQWQEMVLML